MKKGIYLFLALFFLGYSILANNNDYEIVKTDGIYYYSTLSINGIYPTTFELKNEKVTDTGRIITGFHGGGARITQESTWVIILGPNSSFFGDSVYIDNEGNAEFYNVRNKKVYIKNVNYIDPWVYCIQNDSFHVKAEYISRDFIEIFEGVYDSCAKIKLSAYKNDILLANNYYTNKEILISKAYGVVKLLSINGVEGPDINDDLEFWPSQFYLIGYDIDSNPVGFEWKYPEVISSVEIGTIVQYYSDDPDDYYRNRQYRVLDKYYVDSFLVYDIEIQKYRTSIEYDIDTTYESRYYLLNLQPNKTLYSSNCSLESGRWGFKNYYDFNGRLRMDFSRYRKHSESQINGKTVWQLRPEVIGCHGTNGKFKFIEGLGDFLVTRGECYGGDEISYYKTPDDEWGERLSGFPEPPPPPPAEIPLSSTGILIAILGMAGVLSWKYLKL